MGKTVVNPVTKWPGSVTIADPILLPAALVWERSQAAADALLEPKLGEDGQPVKDDKGDVIHQRKAGVVDADFLTAWQPGINATVEAWNIEGYSHDPLTASPKGPAQEMVMWLVTEINKVYYGVGESPNE